MGTIFLVTQLVRTHWIVSGPVPLNSSPSVLPEISFRQKYFTRRASAASQRARFDRRLNMELEMFSQNCRCGRSFSQDYALTNHQRTCQKSKKRLSSALAKAKQLWTGRKKPRLAVPVPPVSTPEPTASSENTPLEVCSRPIVILWVLDDLIECASP
jgi:hypothetical protein